MIHEPPISHLSRRVSRETITVRMPNRSGLFHVKQTKPPFRDRGNWFVLRIGVHKEQQRSCLPIYSTPDAEWPAQAPRGAIEQTVPGSIWRSSIISPVFCGHRDTFCDHVRPSREGYALRIDGTQAPCVHLLFLFVDLSGLSRSPVSSFSRLPNRSDADVLRPREK